MKKSLVIVAIALAFAWTGFPRVAYAGAPPPMQGVLAVVDGTGSHVIDIWLMPNTAGTSSVVAGPPDLEQFIVTSSTGVYDAAGRAIATDQLWRCVGTAVKTWSHVASSLRVADRIALGVEPGSIATGTCAHALSGNGSTISSTAANGGIGGEVSTGGGSARSDDSRGSGGSGSNSGDNSGSGSGGAGGGAGSSSAAGGNGGANSGNGGNNGGAGNGSNSGSNGGGNSGNGANNGGAGNGSNGGGNGGGNGGHGNQASHGNGGDSAGVDKGQGGGLSGDKAGIGHKDKEK